MKPNKELHATDFLTMKNIVAFDSNELVSCSN